MASEELKQTGQQNGGYAFGAFEYFDLGATTISTCVKQGILPSMNSAVQAAVNKRKPDGLIVDRRGGRLSVIAVIEFKDNSRKDDGIAQASEVGALLGAKFCVTTDTSVSAWYLPDVAKSYTPILDENGQPLSEVFGNVAGPSRDAARFERNVLLTQAICERLVGARLQPKTYLDPSALARSIWQDLYVGSGSATPERALSTFVELFMFKFLSDLGVLTKNDSEVDISFGGVLASGKKACLNRYWTHVRPEIRALFPAAAHDGTTLINGFALTAGNADHAKLFHKILTRFSDFEKIHEGRSLRDIDREFKSRLYEEFLKGSVGQKSAGQFFTPRKVMRAIVEMADVSKLPEGSTVCDPACGVGGFLLEASAMRKAQGIDDFLVRKDGRLAATISYVGFEKDPVDDRDNGKLAVILAKSNFVIYQSDLIAKNPHLTKEVARTFNDMFSLKKGSILGSLQTVEPDSYDLILSNPPYVASGASNLKIAAEDRGLPYTANGCGIEGLFLEKIVRELKPNKQAFVVLPEGTLTRDADGYLRAFVTQHCMLDAVISLPKKTFFATTKKTYILCLTKKNQPTEVQRTPVFCYLVSDIGETMDSRRLPSDRNDLPDMVRRFKAFQAIKSTDSAVFELLESSRCKLIAADEFLPTIGLSKDVLPLEALTDKRKLREQSQKQFGVGPAWKVEARWSKDELEQLGIDISGNIVGHQGWGVQLASLQKELESLLSEYKSLTGQDSENHEYRQITFKELFDVKKGDARWTNKFASENKGEYPLYTAATKKIDPARVNSWKFEEECLFMTTNGHYAGTVFHFKPHRFSCNGDTRVLVIKGRFRDVVDYGYARLALTAAFSEHGFNWDNKPGLKKIADIALSFPSKAGGLDLDLPAQQKEAEMWRAIQAQKASIEKLLQSFAETRFDYQLDLAGDS